MITELPVTLVAQSQALPGFNVYVTQRVVQRVKELRREGRDPRGETRNMWRLIICV